MVDLVRTAEIRCHRQGVVGRWQSSSDSAQLTPRPTVDQRGHARSILGLMPTRVVRFLVGVLALVLLAQPIPPLAFASSDSASCCCRGKSATCCRRMHGMPHGHSSGPALSSRECCGQCQISVRQSQPVAATVAPATTFAEPAPAISRAIAALDGFRSTHSDLALYQRPPPSAV
jgi:hypothetical protein